MADGVFISYRRDGGEAMAQLVHDRLVERGYTVFYDIESLSSGVFDTKIFRKIETCRDFVLILPAQSLDRCVYEEDWVRKEIRHALKCEKNIIPIMLRGFVFPNDLPEDIREVRRFQGVGMETMELIDAKMDRLMSMLKSKSSQRRRKKSGYYDTENDDATRRPSLISSISVMGAVDRDEPWPSGEYSPIVDLDAFNVARFHISLVKPFAEDKTVAHGFRIYDDDVLVCEVDTTIDMKKGDNRYSVGWIIRGLDGSYVKAGKYRAVFWIDDSHEYTAHFRVVSAEQVRAGLVDEEPKEEIELTLEEQKRMKNLKCNLAMPKLFWGFVLSFLALIVFTVAAPYGGAFLFITLLCLALSLLNVVRMTKKYVTDNMFFAILLVILGLYFSVYVAFMAIISVFKGKAWKKELDALEAKML